MATETAPADGIYERNGGRFRVKQGDPLPEGATFAADADAPKPEKRARKPASENRAKADAGETRAKDGTG